MTYSGRQVEHRYEIRGNDVVFVAEARDRDGSVLARQAESVCEADGGVIGVCYDMKAGLLIKHGDPELVERHAGILRAAFEVARAAGLLAVEPNAVRAIKVLPTPEAIAELNRHIAITGVAHDIEGTLRAIGALQEPKESVSPPVYVGFSSVVEGNVADIAALLPALDDDMPVLH